MEPEKKSNGAFIGLVVIIIILILGGVYIWKTNKDRMKAEPKAVTQEDQNDLNQLDLDANNTDTNLGVDANSIN